MKERYRISGMTCSACSAHVEKAVSRLEGMEKASVNLLTETMEVSYQEGQLTSDQIIEAVVKAGYGAFLMAGGDRESAGSSGGAESVKGGRQGLQRKAREEVKAMKWRLGISFAFWIPLMYVAMYHMFQEWFGIPVPEWVHRYLHGAENAVNFALTQLLLLLPILYVNRKFFAVGFKTLIGLAPNMDSLIALGASAAIGYGIFAMYRIGYGMGHGEMELVERYSADLYFESAGTILTLITLGKFLESRSKGKTSEAITKLMDLSPKTAILLTPEGQEQEIPTERLKAGDIFLVKPGSLVPVDGTVMEGHSSIDEAAITGESVPVEKKAGDQVVSATVNKAGFLKCRADRVGEDTTLSQIIRLVEEAGASKAPIAQLADKVAGVFVPVVIGIALITFLAWLFAGMGAEFAISSAIAVLVISCPCALGLATPVAIMVGTGVGANHGVLIKSGEALQRAKEIDTVVMDKTGTVTTGKLRVHGCGCYAPGLSVETLLQVAAALEKKSEHPLAEAVVEAARVRKLPIPEIRDFKAVFGRGIEGVLGEGLPPRPMMQIGDGPTAFLAAGMEAADSQRTERRDDKEKVKDLFAGRMDEGFGAGTRFFVGNRAYMEENGIEIDPVAAQGLDSIAEEGRTPLLVAQEGRLLGEIDVKDGVKAGSCEAIRKFKDMGIHVVMLTGDNRKTAESVQRELGMDEVIAEVLPQQKEQKIRQLQEAGRKVAMIGDGINDAPALAAADVGMAIGAGTDVAMESADIVLMKSDLRDAVTAVRLSRAVIRNIKQNLFWAFFYNIIGIPLAAGVWFPLFHIRLNPMFGAAAMSLSSIFVVSNALRLKLFRSGFAQAAPAPGEKALLSETNAGPDGGARQGEVSGAEDVSCSMTADTIKKQEREDKKMTKVMTIEGMMCAHCTGRVQKALEEIQGVGAVNVSLEDKTATVELDGAVTDEALKAAVSEAGYEVIQIR